MRLCNDEDRFSLDTLSAGTWNVCVYFSHDEIDIDIGLATAWENRLPSVRRRKI